MPRSMNSKAASLTCSQRESAARAGRRLPVRLPIAAFGVQMRWPERLSLRAFSS